MRTAVIYSGQARTFKQVAKNQYFNVLRKLPNPTIFVSIAADEQAEDMRILEGYFPGKVIMEKVSQPAFIMEPFSMGGDMAGNAPWHAGYPPSTHAQGILKQLWSLGRAWNFVEEQDSSSFDLYVRIRPDLAFHRFDAPSWQSNPHLALTPWWARWGGVNDRFAYLGHQAAQAYFGTFQARQAMFDEGCPLHPETMVNYSMQRQGITVSHTLAAEFTTVRLDGTHIPPSITLSDLAEYSRSK